MDPHVGHHVLEREGTVVGSGFLASGLRDVVAHHSPVTLYAAGPGSSVTSEAEFTRDAQRLYQTLSACRINNRRLLYLSTSSAHLYGRNPAARHEDDPVEPYSAYGRHKLAMETVIRQSGIAFLILRLPNPVGPHQPADQFVPTMIRQVLDGRVTVWGGARRDLMALQDIADIVSALLDTSAENDVVNIGTGAAVSAIEIVRLIGELLGVESEIAVTETAAEPSASVAKLRNLLPSFTLPGGAGYLRRILRDHIAALELGK